MTRVLGVPMRCDVTGNPVGTDTVMVGAECDCQGCRASAEIDRLRDLVAHLRLQAQGHAQEARGANATIAEAYQVVTGATGEPGNWNGAKPIRAEVDRLRALVKSMGGDPR
jgi:hypothetical protein